MLLTIRWSKILECPHIGGHHTAKNWRCPDTVDTNGLKSMISGVVVVLAAAAAAASISVLENSGERSH